MVMAFVESNITLSLCVWYRIAIRNHYVHIHVHVNQRQLLTQSLSAPSAVLRCRVSLDMLSVQGETGPAWADKSPIAFWRGRDSRQERLDLVRLSRQHPDVIDAKLTNMFFFKHSDDLGEVVKHISFYDFFKVSS